ncbi:lipase member I-like [Asterias rubens]|uniref:lipase member I-like n=1 Tax=Asterias rubens TaxID=7604 RepID=UPI0014554A29|nr:lipase member I-like [Asterias rubens]
MKTLKEKLLQKEDLNVVLVDWGSGARDLYGQAVQNIRVVGRVVAKFAQFLNTEAGTTFANMHLIGFSLGAHIAGYAGAYQPGIGRISGLDPAGPNFNLNDPACRLDPTDALFVDVIHSDAELLGLGIEEAVGDVDFYVNGGKEQPGCPVTIRDIFDDISELSCNHSRACELYIDSVDETQCAITGFPCNSWEDFLAGKCNDCGAQDCPKLGYSANSSSLKGNIYLQTGSRSPFCKF